MLRRVMILTAPTESRSQMAFVSGFVLASREHEQTAAVVYAKLKIVLSRAGG